MDVTLLIWLALLVLGVLCAALWRERRKLAHNNRFADLAINQTDDGVVVQDMKGRVVWANPAFCRIMGRDHDEIIGRNPMEFALLPQAKPTDDEIQAFRFDPEDPSWRTLELYHNKRKSGEEFWNQVRVSFHQPDVNGEVFAISVCRDVSEEVERENRLRAKTAELDHVAHHDMLTGAATRSRLVQFANSAIDAAREFGHHVGLLQIDLDKFKFINDTFGHGAGDAVLQHVTQQARSCLRETDLLARIGGDEFVVVCPRMESAEVLQRIGASILEAIRTPVTVGENQITPSVSIGATVSIAGRHDIDDLLRQADFALYDVKNAGRGAVALYDPSRSKTTLRKLRQMDALQKAVTEQRIAFQYQPMIDAGTNQLFGVSITPSWQDADGSLIDPADLRAQAKTCGILPLLDEQVLRAALDWQTSLHALGYEDIRTCGWLTASLLENADHLARLLDVFEANGPLASGHVCCITDLLHADPDAISTALKTLKQAGPDLWGDGTTMGFRQLAYADLLHLSGLQMRVDLSGDAVLQQRKRTIHHHMIASAVDLSLKVCLTQLTTDPALDFATSTEAAILQGSVFAPRMSKPDALDWLGAHVDRQTGRTAPIGRLPLPARTAI